jgi:hypothetical protein
MRRYLGAGKKPCNFSNSIQDNRINVLRTNV